MSRRGAYRRSTSAVVKPSIFCRVKFRRSWKRGMKVNTGGMRKVLQVTMSELRLEKYC